MRAPSFRFRLAIFSTLVSGVILVAFGVAAWVFVYRNLVDSVDSRLRAFSDRMVPRVHENRDWDHFRDGMRFFGREVERETVVLVVSNIGRKRLFQSERTVWMKDEKNAMPYLPSAEMLASAPPQPTPHTRPPRRDEPRSEEGGAVGEAAPPERSTRRPEDRAGGDRTRFPGDPRGGWKPLGEPRFFTVSDEDGKRWRTVASSNSSVTVFVGIDLADVESELGQVRNYFLVALPLGLLAVAGGAWAISRRAIRPLEQIVSTTSEMNAAYLDRRIPVTGNESREFSQLVEVLNAMMDRLEGSFHQATRFTADASHELKTPIAIMQAEIESAIKSCPPDSAEEASLMTLQEENQRLKRITQSLLLLSQADSGKLRLTEEDVDFSRELEGLVEDAELLCAKEHLSFEGKIGSGIHVLADRVLLMQAVQNLLSNAIKYNCPEGRISCELREQGEEVVLEFFNTGTPIPEDDQGKVFDRFFRVDKSRGVAVEGFGLGLNLSLEIVRAHGGKLRLAESVEVGTRMEMRLPKA